jgi:F-type H+-transporting ATPase subunit delta
VAQGSDNIIARRYAKALFDLALAAGSADTVEADLKQLRQLLETRREVSRFLENPTVSREQHAAFLQALSGDNRYHALTGQTLRALVANRRQKLLALMVDAYIAMAQARRGEVTAKVTSALPMKDNQRSELQKMLEQMTGKKITLQEKVDASLLGGFVVTVAGKTLDGSLKGRLAALKQTLAHG